MFSFIKSALITLIKQFHQAVDAFISPFAGTVFFFYDKDGCPIIKDSPIYWIVQF